MATARCMKMRLNCSDNLKHLLWKSFNVLLKTLVAGAVMCFTLEIDIVLHCHFSVTMCVRSSVFVTVVCV